MAGGLRNALLGVPFVLVILLAVFAASPWLATCGGHDEVVTATVLKCPRAVELLGEDAHPTAHVTVTCKAGIGESGGAAPSGALAVYDGDGTFSMEVGDPSRRDDDRSELADAKTSDQDRTPGCRLSSAGDQGTLTIWDAAPAFEIVVAL